MAGSYAHLIDDDGSFRMDLIENLGDAHEALEECFFIIETMKARGHSVEGLLDDYYRMCRNEQPLLSTTPEVWRRCNHNWSR